MRAIPSSEHGKEHKPILGSATRAARFSRSEAEDDVFSIAKEDHIQRFQMQSKRAKEKSRDESKREGGGGEQVSVAELKPSARCPDAGVDRKLQTSAQDPQSVSARACHVIHLLLSPALCKEMPAPRFLGR